ncbi:vitronectin-like isoform X2 [Scyliorhinus torazame]|uniref:vitronectin-like isoform X2 n=1 Tax=Scyliorhinus torazame TaxID=75743 RepID=UPI003B595C7A
MELFKQIAQPNKHEEVKYPNPIPDFNRIASSAMKPLIALLSCSLLSAVYSDEESCVGRCDLGFFSLKKCQCDSLCRFYKSCCTDYHTACKKVRGDVFHLPEDEYTDTMGHMMPNYDDSINGTIESELEPEPELDLDLDLELEPELDLDLELELDPELEPELDLDMELEPDLELELELDLELELEPELDLDTELDPELQPELEPELDLEPELEPEQEPVNLCTSEESFDAFTDLKNGSIFAFQGEYYYELDKFSVVSEHPRLISDVWGMPGPIDAALTRVNCEGKTYIFKNESYWRFNDGILEDGFPKLIKNGFPGIPNNIDASLAVPASSIDGNERVYFFKGAFYWEYLFQNQPTQQDCAASSTSVPFARYTNIMDDSFEDFFLERTSGPYSIRRGWRGIPGRVDSAMIGKLYFMRQFPGNRRKKPKKHSRRNQRRRWWGQQSSSQETDLFPLFPSQSVYFFVRDKYYRVDLESKRVAHARPFYPRSIARYWFKCTDQMLMHE